MKKLKSTGYLRYSDLKQEDNHSLEIQKSHIQTLAERENLEIIAWRADKATSAFHNNVTKREGIQLTIADIKNGAEAVCFYEESRITRSITDFYNEVYLPIKMEYPHVKFFSTQSEAEWNPNDPIVQAKLVFAAEESEIKSVRAKDAQKGLLYREHPTRPGSRTPIGYEMIGGVLHPNKDAEIVQLIFHLACWGHSHEKIADYLNKCNITTKKVKYWNSSTIGYILSNKVYSGNLAWNVRTSYESSKPKHESEIDLFKNVHEPIVSPTVFHLSKQVNDLKKQFGTMNTPYYLRTIIKCKKCNCFLVAKDNSPKGKNGKYMIYKCTRCKKSVPIITTHQAVLNDLQKKWNTQLLYFSATSKEQLKSWSTKLTKTTSNIKQLLEKVQYNQIMMSNDIENNSLLAEVFHTTQQHLKNELIYTNETLDEMDSLLKDDYLDKILKEMIQQSFFNFTDTELRVFFLMYFEEVAINFENNNEIHINYRLSPFVSLDISTGYITEQFK
ncbi:recombinase family protein [Lysinibacillus fusiformis]|uniref:recombinase family protein n=1 Tax=Lysinibacillus sp. PWR01 TaxID=3342384 RepID=UPI00372D1D3C